MGLSRAQRPRNSLFNAASYEGSNTSSGANKEICKTFCLIQNIHNLYVVWKFSANKPAPRTPDQIGSASGSIEACPSFNPKTKTCAEL
jgi:hypothetical protein